MAAYTSTQTGNWSSTSTWGGSGPPGAGDTATVATGHTVTVDTNTTIGTSPAAGNSAVTVNGSGVLSISASVTLAVRGDLSFAGAGTLRMRAGSVLEFDGSASSAAYKLSKNYLTNFDMVGTTGNEAVIRSNASGPNAYVVNTGSCNSLVVTDAVFLRLGGTSTSAWKVQVNDSSANKLLVTRLVMDACGQFELTAARADVRVEIAGLVHRNSVGSTNVGAGLGTGTVCFAVGELVTKTTGTRILSGHVADLPITFYTADWTISYVVWLRGKRQGSESRNWASFTKGFIRHANNADIDFSPNGGATDCYTFGDGTSATQIADNWHSWTMANANLRAGTTTFTGLVWDGYGVANATDSGELLNLPNPSTAQTAEMVNCLSLPSMTNQNGQSYKACLGGLCSSAISGTNTNLTRKVRHCTAYLVGSAAAGIQLGENHTARAGEVAEYKSNLVWGPAANGCTHIRDLEATDTTDAVTVGAADYNHAWNPRAGVSPNPAGYDCTNTVALGAHDTVGGDPLFVAPTRNLTTWAVSRGSASGTTAGQIADAITYLSADPTLIDDLLAHVRAGFAPRNSVLSNAGHDGVTIGALAMGTQTYSEVGSGGAFGASSALAAASYSPTIVGAGGLLNGNSSVTVSDSLVIALTGAVAASSGAVRMVYSSPAASGGCYLSGTYLEAVPPSPPSPPRTAPYPVITFRVNLDQTSTRGTLADSAANRQYLLSLERLFIPGVGEVKHGDEFVLFGVEADYVRRHYSKIGRLPYDPQNTLDILSIE